MVFSRVAASEDLWIPGRTEYLLTFSKTYVKLLQPFHDCIDILVDIIDVASKYIDGHHEIAPRRVFVSTIHICEHLIHH